MQERTQSEKLWSATFVAIIFISSLIAMTGTGMHNGINIHIEMSDGPTTLAGAIVFSFTVATMLGRFFSGALSDTRGRRFAILFGTACSLVGCLLGLVAHNVYLLLPSRALMGFGFSFVSTACNAAITDCTPKSRLGEGMGYYSLGYAVSMAIGPFVSIALVRWHGTLTLFGGFLFILVIMAFLGVTCKYAPQTFKPTVRELRERAIAEGTEPPARSMGAVLGRVFEKSALRPAIVQFFITAAQSMFLVYVSSYAMHAELPFGQLYFFVLAGTMILVRLTLGKAIDRFSVNSLLIPSLVAGIIACLLLIFTHSAWTLIVTGLFYGFSLGLSQPIISTTSLKYAPADRRGAASGTYQLSVDFGFGLGGVIWGAVIDAAGYGAVFWGAIVALLVAIALALTLLRNK